MATSQEILDSLLQAAVDNPAGVTMISIDGQQTMYSTPAQLNAAIDFWKNKVAVESGTRPRVRSINLSGF